ncbi:hypothetical protein D1818_15040 [Aquimarina sp. BL5]|nr:hypothetical protein D1818_15040 [Aquimarina sp. BL5]RKN05166.1 hypothetical protein D7036_11010 [Aquimarina sp. BL5]
MKNSYHFFFRSILLKNNTVRFLLIIFISNIGRSQIQDSILFNKNDARVFKNKLIIDQTEIYNTKTDYDRFMEKNEMPNTDCTAHFESYYNPLSLVGNFYSYEYKENAESACGTPGGTVSVKSISLKTGNEITILKLFEEKDVVDAFKNDSWVLKKVKEYQIDIESIQSLKDITGFLQNPYVGIKFTKSGFCILDFKKGKATIRFVATEYMRFNHNQHLQLGMILPVKVEALSFFKDKENFFLGKYKNWLQK